ncbi:MerR family transcriptional regulator [Rummeliibacillus pycnus]|uniref:helix-turn-helix domain-containing protein n=1 Tax=Rummeliibacillus pycnus TaxID=101070 RepID=UPI003D2845C4
MQIAEFIEKVQTSKDTIRYYEEFNLIDPIKKGNKRVYTEKDIYDFYIIREMEALGLTIKEIQTIFHIKRSMGFHSPTLLQGTKDRLYASIMKIEKAERDLSTRKMKLFTLISKLEEIAKVDNQ